MALQGKGRRAALHALVALVACGKSKTTPTNTLADTPVPQVQVLGAVDRVAVLSSKPGRIVAGRQARAQIDAALRALPPPLREVIVLRELEGLEYAEIARIAAIPVGTVMSRLARARERLRASLGTVGSEP